MQQQFDDGALQHQGNYFNRIRNQFGHSEESIGLDRQQQQQQQLNGNTLAPPPASASPSGCSKCRSGESKLHKSEYDIYGSRLSTRMQDTAKSAWRSTKKLATSMVTSGVSLTACRHKSTSSSMRRVKPSRKNKKASNKQAFEGQQEQQQQQPVHITTFQQQHWSTTTASNGDLHGDDGGQLASPPEVHHNNNERFHTSVVKLEAGGHQHQNLEHAMDSQHQYPDQCQRMCNPEDQHNSQILLKDQHNKLTIVTKFAKQQTTINANNNIIMQTSSASNEHHQSTSSSAASSSSSVGLDRDEIGAGVNCAVNGLASSGPASASGGERSRCESASSGRGTSEDDAQSTAGAGGQSPSVTENSRESQAKTNDNISIKGQHEQHEEEQRKHHKRANSVFKASQLLPKSAANQLKSQLKSFFTNSTATTRSITLKHDDDAIQAHHADQNLPPTQIEAQDEASQDQHQDPNQSAKPNNVDSSNGIHHQDHEQEDNNANQVASEQNQQHMAMTKVS